ncbi:MAG: hypothetical protein AUK03_14905 [Anaerolineae bacterium CG2_30_64_16]|nr:MAG: hypothetical protein AUK03_14905 [Anaerolineae bacterium CG2_30_64_16]
MRGQTTLRLFLAIVVLLLGLGAATVAFAQSGSVHVVRPGDTLSGIGRSYGVSPAMIASANGIANPDRIFVGQKLVIPTSEPGAGTVHVVAHHMVGRGETLYSIARRYGVTLQQLAAYNNIADPNRILVGQMLRIPPPVNVTPIPTIVTPAPTVTPLPMPTPAGCQCEAIVIQEPTQRMTVTSPVTVVGLGSGFEQTVVVAVLDGSGGQIGLAPATVVGEYGQQGTFTATVPFEVPANSQLGRIQVWSESPRDGAIEHLNSVTVMIQGLDLDALLADLADAVVARDYAALIDVMGDPFQLSHYRSEGVSLAPAQVIERLQEDYLGPGAPYLDFSVNARDLLGDRVSFGPDIVHVVYSPRWGQNAADDAFLLIGDVAGRARWVGMLYVPEALIDYR